MTEEQYILENFDLKGLRRIGFLRPHEVTMEQIEKRICTWFGYKTIFEFTLPKEPEHLKPKIDTFSQN